MGSVILSTQVELLLDAIEENDKILFRAPNDQEALQKNEELLIKLHELLTRNLDKKK